MSRNSTTTMPIASGACGWLTELLTMLWTAGRTSVPGTTPTADARATGSAANALAGAAGVAALRTRTGCRRATGPMNATAVGRDTERATTGPTKAGTVGPAV